MHSGNALASAEVRRADDVADGRTWRALGLTVKMVDSDGQYAEGATSAIRGSREPVRVLYRNK